MSSRRVSLLAICLVCFGVGYLVPARASQHCDTELVGSDHYHRGQDNVNNNCETNGHPDNVTEYFTGAGGNDTLRGGAGVDRIKGQAGDYDLIYGGYGAYDVLEGGSGVVGDYIWGENDVDHIFGGEDRDRMRGDEGNDILTDSCCGSLAEKDHACGSGGHDEIYVQDGDAEDNIYDPGGTDYISRDYDISEGGIGNDAISTADCPF